MADREETIALIILLLEEQEEHIASAYVAQSQQSRRIIRTAMARIEADLMASRWGTWGAMERAATLGMVRRGFVQLGGQLSTSLESKIPSIVSQSIIDTGNFLKNLDSNFGAGGAGVVRPLRFDTLEFLDRTTRDIGQIRLREFPQSFRRYGASAVVAIEEQLGVLSLQGLKWTEARDEVWDVVRGVVRDRQWMVERILRTEVSAVHNGTELAAIREEAKEDIPGDEMKKRLVATWDQVTGEDSMYVHGQIREPDEMFEDNVGRRYLAPPNRPHDREIVVPWRTSYEEFFPDYPKVTKDGTFIRPNISIPKHLEPVDDIFQGALQAEIRALREKVTSQRKLLTHFRAQMRTLEGDAKAQFAAQVAQVEFSIGQLTGQISALSG